MDTTALQLLLDDPARLEECLQRLGIDEPDLPAQKFRDLAQEVPLDLLTPFFTQLEQSLPAVKNADRTLSGLLHFTAVARSPLAMLSLIDRDHTCLPLLLQIIDASSGWAELLERDPEAFDFLRLTEGMPSSRDELQAEIESETALLTDERTLIKALHRLREREQLRIGYGELYRHVRIELAMQQLSDLAECLIAKALHFALQNVQANCNFPLPRLALIGLGRLGSGEQDYQAGLELLFVSENLPPTKGRNLPQEMLERIARQTVRILSDEQDQSCIYPVSFPIVMGEAPDTLVRPLDEILHYCDAKGRTWERSILLRARCIAGDEELGNELLSQLHPWLYRRYLNRADETGMRALKRRIEREAASASADDPIQGPGGIKPMEDAIRFLQLLNGGELEIVRAPGTLAGIAGLEQGEVLDVEERSVLEQGYERFRQWQHRSQLLTNHSVDCSDLAERQKRQAAVLERLLASAFSGEPTPDPVSELILEPMPSNEMINTVLKGYGFRDVPQAVTHLRSLAVERISFLSTRRSRHFLAEIAPSLLQSIAATPDPDYTLTNLVRVSDSLGGKGVLWELFGQHRASQELYVRLCGGSLYLSELLISNPGMIDDLLDSLHLSQLPTVEELQALVADLFPHGPEQASLGALATFRQSQHLRIGVREMLGLEDVAATHQALAAVAEVCVQQVVQAEYTRMVQRYGEPTTPEGQRCELVVVALGKLGGKEPNYHSPLELAFIYESEGTTQPPLRSRSTQLTTNAHFFAQVVKGVLKSLTELGPRGRLYEVQTPLRPQGKTGPIAISLDDLQTFIRGESLVATDLLALLVRARAIYGSAPARAAVENRIVDCLLAKPWQASYGANIRQQRQREVEAASGKNLKKAPGGTTDVEAVIKALQWQHADVTGLMGVGTLAAIERLRERGWLSPEDAAHWDHAYRTLRTVESGLRLMNVPARHDLPTNDVDWGRLAMVLKHPSPSQLAEQVREVMTQNRLRFDRFFAAS